MSQRDKYLKLAMIPLTLASGAGMVLTHSACSGDGGEATEQAATEEGEKKGEKKAKGQTTPTEPTSKEVSFVEANCKEHLADVLGSSFLDVNDPSACAYMEGKKERDAEKMDDETTVDALNDRLHVEKDEDGNVVDDPNVKLTELGKKDRREMEMARREGVRLATHPKWSMQDDYAYDMDVYNLEPPHRSMDPGETLTPLDLLEATAEAYDNVWVQAAETHHYKDQKIRGFALNNGNFLVGKNRDICEKVGMIVAMGAWELLQDDDTKDGSTYEPDYQTFTKPGDQGYPLARVGQAWEVTDEACSKAMQEEGLYFVEDGVSKKPKLHKPSHGYGNWVDPETDAYYEGEWSGGRLRTGFIEIADGTIVRNVEGSTLSYREKGKSGGVEIIGKAQVEMLHGQLKLEGEFAKNGAFYGKDNFGYTYTEVFFGKDGGIFGPDAVFNKKGHDVEFRPWEDKEMKLKIIAESNSVTPDGLAMVSLHSGSITISGEMYENGRIKGTDQFRNTYDGFLITKSGDLSAQPTMTLAGAAPVSFSPQGATLVIKKTGDEIHPVGNVHISYPQGFAVTANFNDGGWVEASDDHGNEYHGYVSPKGSFYGKDSYIRSADGLYIHEQDNEYHRHHPEDTIDGMARPIPYKAQVTFPREGGEEYNLKLTAQFDEEGMPEIHGAYVELPDGAKGVIKSKLSTTEGGQEVIHMTDGTVEHTYQVDPQDAGNSAAEGEEMLERTIVYNVEWHPETYRLLWWKEGSERPEPQVIKKADGGGLPWWMWPAGGIGTGLGFAGLGAGIAALRRRKKKKGGTS